MTSRVSRIYTVVLASFALGLLLFFFCSIMLMGQRTPIPSLVLCKDKTVLAVVDAIHTRHWEPAYTDADRWFINPSTGTQIYKTFPSTGVQLYPPKALLTTPSIPLSYACQYALNQAWDEKLNVDKTPVVPTLQSLPESHYSSGG